MSTSEQQLVGVGQMARRLGVTTRWLRREVEAGRLPALKAEDRLLFAADVVTQILAKRAAHGVGTPIAPLPEEVRRGD